MSDKAKAFSRLFAVRKEMSAEEATEAQEAKAQDTLVPQAKVSETNVPDTKVQEPPVARIGPEPAPQATVAHEATLAWRALVQNPGQWTAFPNEISDKVLGLLDVYEQSILQRLYRLSHGYHQETCRVGLDKLARFCNMSRRQVQRSLDKLITRGLVERVDYDLGNSVRLERGTVYRVSLPSADLARQTKAPRTLAPETKVPQTPNKERDKKQKIKIDASQCPDCRGTGMWYPEGFERGVARCSHQKLVSKSEGA